MPAILALIKFLVIAYMFLFPKNLEDMNQVQFPLNPQLLAEYSYLGVQQIFIDWIYQFTNHKTATLGIITFTTQMFKILKLGS